LHVAFTKTPYDAGKHVGSKSGGLDPTDEESAQELDEKNNFSTHMSADNMFPIMLIKRTFLRPYLSERDPMCGDTKNCKVLQLNTGK
jgi:hypothetical protein